MSSRLERHIQEEVSDAVNEHRLIQIEAKRGLKLIAKLPNDSPLETGYISQPGDLHPGIDPEPKGYDDKHKAHELARRRRSRVGIVDGHVMIGGDTWKEELVRVGVRPDRRAIYDKKKLTKPGGFQERKLTLASKRKPREDWVILARDRIRDRNLRRMTTLDALSAPQGVNGNGHRPTDNQSGDQDGRLERYMPPATRRLSHSAAR